MKSMDGQKLFDKLMKECVQYHIFEDDEQGTKPVKFTKEFNEKFSHALMEEKDIDNAACVAIVLLTSEHKLGGITVKHATDLWELVKVKLTSDEEWYKGLESMVAQLKAQQSQSI